MDKTTYEQNPRAYWEVPELIGKKWDYQSVPTEEESPLWINEVLPEIKLNKWHKVCVDLGCGAGRYLHLSASAFDKVIGVDFSRHSLNQAKQWMRDINNIEYVLASLADMKEVETEIADFAYSCAVFMHMPNSIKSQALKELARILHKDGRAVLMEVYPIASGAFDCPDITADEWHRLISEAGLKIEKELVSSGHPLYKRLVLRK